MNKGRYIGKFLAVCLLLISNIAWAATETAELSAINITSTNQKTRISLTLSGKFSYKAYNLSNPDRIAIDFVNVKLTTTLSTLKLTNTPLTHVRQGHPKSNIMRLVFDLKQKQQMNLEVLPEEQKLIINLTGTHTKNTATNETPLQQTSTWAAEDLPEDDNATLTKQEVLPSSLPKPTPIPTTTPATTPVPIPAAEKPITPNKIIKTTTTPEPELPAIEETTTPIANAENFNGKRAIVVIVDPGHGGKDPGTLGTMGIREKDVVLAISKQVHELLNKESGFRAVLTRDDDYFIPLRGRLNIARKNRGDIFIAIHADAYINSYAGGSSVFTLSAHGASSEAARWLAERENTSELGGVSLNDKSKVLRSVLIDLSQSAMIASSMQSGKSILRQLSKVGRLHRGFVEQAPFMVLKNPDIPSMLIETGFLSNPLEEQRLRDPYYQRKLATAIVDGIKDYFYNNPPPGTWVASTKQNKRFS